MRHLVSFVAVTSLSLAAFAAPSGSGAVWTPISPETMEAAGGPHGVPGLRPEIHRSFSLDPGALAARLAEAPMEATERRGVSIQLPRPDGTLERFAVWESPIMEPGLSTWFATQGYPMKTYKGTSLDAAATTVRLDWGGPDGLHAWVVGPGTSYFIDPAWRLERRHYVVYRAGEYASSRPPFVCDYHENPEARAEAPVTQSGGSRLAPGELRTVRLANAATGEYTQFHGGTAAQGQAAIVTAINRVNQIYERDVAVRMILVANNQSVVYTNPSTDPYSNNNGGAMLSQNISNLNSVIGSANYDIGHVFSTGGGGVAFLGVVCTASKGGGVTGLNSPTGDPFYIDFVAHEMGHQWGGSHTFDGIRGSCSGNRSDSSAYEPGSGSTIMSYAGICSSDNLQRNADAYFHGRSLDQINNHASSRSCDVIVASGNQNAPTVDAGPDYTIPANTPFELTALNGFDGDGDTLSYSWEQWDLSPGSGGDPLSAGDVGDNPIIRARDLESSPSRYFPRLLNINNNNFAAGEILPTTTRTLTFRVVVRDNNPGGGLFGSDTMTINATTAAGPFLVTSPNGGETLSGSATVTWDVAGTAAAPVSTANVDILLSTDFGNTFPTTLVSGTPNDGSETVTLPNVNAPNCRIMVRAAGNVFLDISDDLFAITGSGFSGHHLVGTGLGQPNANQVRIFDAAGGATATDFLAYGAGQWGVNVAAGLADAQANESIYTGPGPGAIYGPHVRGFANDGNPLAAVNYFAYGTLKFGVNVALGDIDGDNFEEILSGAGPGAVFGPHVRGWNRDAAAIQSIAKVSFFVFSTLRWGVNVSAADVDGDGFAEMVVAPGPGVPFGQQVKGYDFDGSSVSALAGLNFFAYSAGQYGANVASGDASGNGRGDIVVTPGPGSGASFPSQFKGYAYQGASVAPLAGFDVTPFTTSYGGRVGLGELTDASRHSMLTGAGRDPAADSTVRGYDYQGGALQALPASFQAFPGTMYGVNVSAGPMGI